MNDPACLKLLKEAAEWRLLSLLLEPPRAQWIREISALAREADDPQLRQAAEAARDQVDQTLYHSTFGPGGPAAPREISHHDCLLPGGLLAELSATYQAFGYRPRLQEPPDHVSVEAGFVAYLKLKEAYARTRGRKGQANRCAEVAEHFLAERLAVTAGPLARALECSGIRYLALASAALLRRAGSAPPDGGLDAAAATRRPLEANR